ncbi:mismatch-specific DNA-glycosylase [Metabacillus sediminilitoris]|uniref:Mismatch-specific DNA-glycosylase n=1 Tax=Metabacillus sediminilitoris TaxID=2567941 RepID=A0A4S4BMC0_9BACI|nr:mismatch-specific DNA-glycosylase [Metabacillus sediminilitoris]QGQ46563.1 mismatch-specific DNA-glycosylase [Metabacillus sediminilitoris]THF75959.1 mismatch-specific DNA-glycosylase [Metabacillus sediminilitoris]
MDDRMDILNNNLTILFIGFNPSLVSAEVCHHYANKHNRFWKIIYEAGITDKLYKPEEDVSLLSKGIGFTNIVSRPTKSANEITSEEYKKGREILRQKISKYKPKIAFFVGKGVYLHYSQRNKADWGKQKESVINGVTDFVAPSSSGLVRMKMDEIISIYKKVNSISHLD